MQQAKVRLCLTVALALVAPLAVAADTGYWLHVRVEEAEGATVKVNLPLSLVEKAIPMIPQEHLRHGKVWVDGHHHLSVAELRELWSEIRTGPDMTFVTVQDDGEDIKVWKRDGYLNVDVLEGDKDTTVNVRIPVPVVDALLSGSGNEIDVAAAIRALVDAGQGELVTVHDEEDRVRVWVDQIAEAD